MYAKFLRGRNQLSTETPEYNYAPRTTRSSRTLSPSLPIIVEHQLRVTLEELFQGCHKKMKTTVNTYDEATGLRGTRDGILEMNLKPGIKKGSKIKFMGVGDDVEGARQDIHFIVEEARLSQWIM